MATRNDETHPPGSRESLRRRLSRLHGTEHSTGGSWGEAPIRYGLPSLPAHGA